MKMRDELELYRTKTIQLEDELRAANSAHEAYLNEWQKTQEQEIAELTAAHKKAIESKDSSIKYKSDQVTELTEQVNNLHDILDVIPGVMTRKKGEDGYGAENKCHVRLASVLAQKFM